MPVTFTQDCPYFPLHSKSVVFYVDDPLADGRIAFNP